MVGAPTMAKKENKNPNAKDTKNPVESGDAFDIRQLVAKFIGSVDGLHEIKIHNVFSDKYRVNVWRKYQKEGLYGLSYEIDLSYFLKIVDGKITDLTKAPSEEPRQLF